MTTELWRLQQPTWRGSHALGVVREDRDGYTFLIDLRRSAADDRGVYEEPRYQTWAAAERAAAHWYQELISEGWAS